MCLESKVQAQLQSRFNRTCECVFQRFEVDMKVVAGGGDGRALGLEEHALIHSLVDNWIQVSLEQARVQFSTLPAPAREW